ncbi:RNA polymerase sigma factor SigJ [Streptomyces laurentii]|uniref:RNA polymerase sigma factor SigJ n=1 Tax=Streptomyces laurentii TaxID=39478 RepID=UPI0036CA45A5
MGPISPTGPAEPDPAAAPDERRRLTGMAYRLLGSLADAEDVVQETYARWYAMSPERRAAVVSPGAYLAKVAGRICLDLLGSARARRERYVGEWIPEPLPGHLPGHLAGPRSAADPADRVTLDESVHMAFLVVLDTMTPAERVAFVLHDVFRYSFAEVAAIVGRTPAACRRLAFSARRRLHTARPVLPARAAREGRHATLVRDFKRAWETQDIAALLGLLAPDATAIGDGGGIVPAMPHPIEGHAAIAHYLVDLIARGGPGLGLEERVVNAQPGLTVRHQGVVVAVFAFDTADDRITCLWAVRNPEKLRPWTAS